MTMLKVLIVEDQPAVVTALQVLFEIRGVACALARSPAEALRRLDGEGADEIGAVVQDMNFSPEATSGEEGIALFHEIKRRDAALPVLLLTAWTSLETAVQLVKEGASDYLAKPWDDEKLLAAVRNLLELRELQLENARLRGRARRSWEDLAGRHDLAGAVWASEKMQAAVTLALQVARGDVPVLITGPSGDQHGEDRKSTRLNASHVHTVHVYSFPTRRSSDLLRELQLENARLRGRARRSWEDLAGRHDLAGAVWASEKMQAAVTLALQVARGDVPVLITGPSGDQHG